MGFIHDPRRVWWRRLLFQVHLWTGLVIGLVVSVVGLTGSLIVFKPELERMSIPHLTHVTPQGERVPVQQLIDTMKRERPRYKLSNLYVYREPDLAWNFRTTGPHGHRIQVYLNPYTGQIIGEDDFKDHWLDWIYELHEVLLLAKPGLTANGIFAWLMVLMSVSGIVVWWPGVKHWRFGFRYHWRAGWKGQNYDAHKLIGFYAAVLLVIVSVTGAYYAFPDSYKRAVAWATAGPATVPTPKSKPRQVASKPTVDAILSRAQAAMPEATPMILFLPTNPTAIYSLRMRLPYDWSRTGSNHVYLDQYTGEVIRADYFVERPIGARIIGVNGPLHFGTFGGDFTRWLWVLLGLTPAILFVSGVIMYWNRVWAKRFRSRGLQANAQAVGERIAVGAPSGD